jgi:membrane protease YdiL (CAAX protease family)
MQLFESVLFFLLYLIFPILVKLAFRNGNQFLSKISDLIVIFSLWLPVELGWVTGVYAPLLGGLELLIIYHYLWPIEQPWGLGFTFDFRSQEFVKALAGYLALVFVLVPLSLSLNFVRWNPSLISIGHILVIVLLAGVEEILFRGAIQNLLVKYLKREYPALVLASVIFGLAHLNNQTLFDDYPNWKYVVLATISGASYGWVWMSSRNVILSTVTHALVNITWKFLFH